MASAIRLSTYSLEIVSSMLSMMMSFIFETEQYVTRVISTKHRSNILKINTLNTYFCKTAKRQLLCNGEKKENSKFVMMTMIIMMMMMMMMISMM